MYLNVINSKNKKIEKQNGIVLSFIFLIFPFFSLPIVFRMAKNGNSLALILWSLFLAVFGFMMFPSNDVIDHWKYYDFFAYSGVNTFLVAWKHDFFLTFFEFYFAKLGIDYNYIVFLFVFIGSCCNLHVFKKILTKNIKYTNNSIVFLIFFLIFPLFSIITGLRNGLAIEFVFLGTYLLFFDKKIMYAIFFFILGCCTHFSVLVTVILIGIIFFMPKIVIRRNKVLYVIIICSLIVFLSLNVVFNYIGANTSFTDKVDGYSESGDMDYIASKSFKWQMLYQIRKLIFIFYVFFFIKTFKNTKLDVLVISLISIVIGTLNYTIINNRFVLLTICFIGLAIVINATNEKNSAILRKFAITLAISLLIFLVQSYSKFLSTPKLINMFYRPYPVLVLDPYTNENYKKLKNSKD